MDNKKKKKIVITAISIIAVILIITIGTIGYKTIKNAQKEKANQTEETQSKNNLKGQSKKPDSKVDNTSLKVLETQSKTKEKKYMENYVILGSIEIPKTEVKANILEETTKRALEIAVTKIYTTGGLNKPGNTVIYGHNYRNSLFFSKNNELEIGDKVYITDEDGEKLTYKIFNKFETSSSDTTFYTRTPEETAGKAEVTLSTCTDDASQTERRLIIQAREI